MHDLGKQVKLDAKDKQLIALLKLNARTSVTELARHVHLARSTVQERIKRLEDNQVIQGYSVNINKEFTEQACICARVAIKARSPDQNTIIKQLSSLPEVTCCESISGNSDLFIEVQTQTTGQLEYVIDKIGQLKGVEHTESSIVLKRFFNRDGL